MSKLFLLLLGLAASVQCLAQDCDQIFAESTTGLVSKDIVHSFYIHKKLKMRLENSSNSNYLILYYFTQGKPLSKLTKPGNVEIGDSLILNLENDTSITAYVVQSYEAEVYKHPFGGYAVSTLLEEMKYSIADTDVQLLSSHKLKSISFSSLDLAEKEKVSKMEDLPETFALKWQETASCFFDALNSETRSKDVEPIEEGDSSTEEIRALGY